MDSRLRALERAAMSGDEEAHERWWRLKHATSAPRISARHAVEHARRLRPLLSLLARFQGYDDQMNDDRVPDRVWTFRRVYSRLQVASLTHEQLTDRVFATEDDPTYNRDRQSRAVSRVLRAAVSFGVVERDGTDYRLADLAEATDVGDDDILLYRLGRFLRRHIPSAGGSWMAYAGPVRLQGPRDRFWSSYGTYAYHGPGYTTRRARKRLMEMRHGQTTA